MTVHVAESHVLSFIGPYAPPVPPLDKEHMGGAIGGLMASFPDFTFNSTKVEPKKTADGGWAADIVVTGTHSGAAFTPMPGMLPAVETTGKTVNIGPETFTLYLDGAGKVAKTTIEPLREGAPAGPPGFYTEIGGVMPSGPPAGPPPPMDCLMMAEVKSFDDWHGGFKAHAKETTIAMNGTTYTLSMSRSAACDESRTEVFCDVEDTNKVAIAMFALDMAKFAPVMQEESFVEMSKAAIASQAPPLIISDPPAPGSEPPAASEPPTMFFWVEVADADAWIAGFKAHANSKTGTWGYEVPITRSDFVDEAKTRVFKSATRPNVVGAYMEGVRMDKLGPLLGDENMIKLTSDLGEKSETKVMKVVTPAPAPP